MSRTIIPMEVADLSAFAKSVREKFSALDHKPSHVEVLNLLSKAAGFRNFQHLRDKQQRAEVIQAWNINADPVPQPVADETRVGRTLRLFSGDGLIIRWPTKRAQQELCLWYLWSKIPRDRLFSEREISALLDTLHTFGDAALLRRDMVDLGMMRRNRDGSDYRWMEKVPPPELPLLLRRIAERAAKAA
ncbi:DUF2087 domain-containing protein [Rhizobiales bacterium RZME27]|uniref:DUF2087 domain-containing protein n=1 Tax=Endobacterium cereale TaxID=2663029 RepID=A0A6A8AIG4_9HYPH|nr:DUF2087 domain-containing protein [Endobacterium cereale]MEB2843880.1 DUF2087 domain-containing protein [Endobacterium cereale]MQY49490.1 DUF2087 domain-containing protein [Endobacterium cereale]